MGTRRMPAPIENPLSGVGVGLRPTHYQAILDNAPRIDWFEALTENYLVGGGQPLYYLDAIAERYPIALHGVSLSIGSTDPLNRVYLHELKTLAARCRPALISDHLCWTGIDGMNTHDLLPLPYHEETLKHLTRRIRQVQDILDRPLVLENISRYVSFSASTFSEWGFLATLTRETGCRLLLDINNIYVNAHNFGFSATDFIDGIPVDAVAQFHIAGHSVQQALLIDTHDQPVSPPVFNLLTHALARFGAQPILLERDDSIPPLDELVGELDTARQLLAAHQSNTSE